MVEEYLSDREQEEALRNWWRDNWRWVVGGVALGLALLVGWQYWQRQALQKSEQAAQTYADFAAALASNNQEKVEPLLKDLDTSHSRSPYNDQAHLAVAHAHVSAGKFEQAIAELKLVSDKSEDPALAQIARLRMARVHLQLGHHDEALALLDVSKAGAFTAQVQEIRGDVLLAKGDRNGARLAYQAAITAGVAPHTAPNESDLLHLKLQDLSDATMPASVSAEVAVPAAVTK
jgi:predicted negative regulator of RcsB-dependent stress response